VNGPNCQAQLVLPALAAEQPVQCPRCRRVFEPGRPLPMSVPASPPVSRRFEEDSIALPLEMVGPFPTRAERLGQLASGLIGICSLLSLVHLGYFVEYTRVLLNGGDGDLWALEDRILTVQNLLRFAVFPTVIVYLTWVYYASRNLRLLKVEGVTTPAGMVWSHLIPCLNLVLGYLSLQEMWRGSDPDLVDRPLSWRKAPASNLTWLLRFRFRGFVQDLENERVGAVLYVFASLMAIVTGVLIILIIRGIAHRQRDRYAEICAESRQES
jgi:hypothetical protein